jgi:hypothetical protein
MTTSARVQLSFITENSNPKSRARPLHCHETTWLRDNGHFTASLRQHKNSHKPLRVDDILKDSCVLCVRDSTIISCCVLSAQGCAKCWLSSCPALNPTQMLSRAQWHTQCVRKVAVHLQNVLEVMSTRVYTGLNPFNIIRKHFLQICVRKVAVHLQKVLEVMSTSVYTGQNPFNFIRKHVL